MSFSRFWISPLVVGAALVGGADLPILEAGCPSCDRCDCCPDCGEPKKKKWGPAAAPRGGVVQTMNARITDQPAPRTSKEEEDRIAKLEKEMEDLSLQLKLIAAALQGIRAGK